LAADPTPRKWSPLLSPAVWCGTVSVMVQKPSPDFLVAPGEVGLRAPPYFPAYAYAYTDKNNKRTTTHNPKKSYRFFFYNMFVQAPSMVMRMEVKKCLSLLHLSGPLTSGGLCGRTSRTPSGPALCGSEEMGRPSFGHFAGLI
jgi:hypothetical protein